MKIFESASFAAIIGLIGVIAGALINAHCNFLGKDQELKIMLIEIGKGILRADPKEDVAPARGWAIEIIQNNSGVKFSEEDRMAVIHKPIKGDFSGYECWLCLWQQRVGAKFRPKRQPLTPPLSPPK